VVPQQANRYERCADHNMPSISYKSRTIELNHCGDDWVCFRSGRMNSESIWMWENGFRPDMKTGQGKMKWLEMWRW
jgi:hypothetical protein